MLQAKVIRSKICFGNRAPVSEGLWNTCLSVAHASPTPLTYCYEAFNSHNSHWKRILHTQQEGLWWGAKAQILHVSVGWQAQSVIYNCDPCKIIGFILQVNFKYVSKLNTVIYFQPSINISFEPYRFFTLFPINASSRGELLFIWRANNIYQIWKKHRKECVFFWSLWKWCLVGLSIFVGKLRHFPA